MGVGLNRASNLFYSNPNRFQSIIKAEKLLRRVDEVYLIDSAGNILFRDRGEKQEEFIIPLEENFNHNADLFLRIYFLTIKYFLDILKDYII